MSLLKWLKILYKGWDGELTVKISHWLYLNKKTYHVFNNVILPKFDGGTTEIDHIIVSVYGIFVVETKNRSGWIYGKENEPTWTQAYSKNKKYVFQNPLRQNYGHIKNISEILKIPENKFHSIVFLIGDCKLKKNMPENVLLKGYRKYIKSKTEKILTEKEVSNICYGIKAYRLPNNFFNRKKHIQYVKSIKKNLLLLILLDCHQHLNNSIYPLV